MLLGRALDSNRTALRKLQDRTTVAIIEVPTPDLVDLVKDVLQDGVLGDSVSVIEGDDCKAADAGAAGNCVILFSRDQGLQKKNLPRGNSAFAAACQVQRAIIGIAADPDRLLPSDLVRLADYRIVLPPLDAETVAAVIEAVTGRKPAAIDHELARNTSIGTLMACVRADLGAAGSLDRLHRLLGQAADAASGPSLAELHGLGAARAWGEALVADLRDYKAGRLPWSEVDRGALITGAPGTGKTTFARALARAADVHFVATSYSSWQSNGDGHLGFVTKAIRAAFAEARRRQPAILFIDEIDSIPTRGLRTYNSEWWTAVVNCLLEELDGFDRREGVIVIASCNDPARLDPALVRAGRLDRHIEIPLPDILALEGIFRTHLADALSGVDLRPAALAARGHTGADVERFVRDARRTARKLGRAMRIQDLLDAAGQDARRWSPDARRRVAYHEAGHAIATIVLGLGEPVALSIDGGGGTTENEIATAQALTRGHYEDILAALLAGRAAEILVCGEPTAGAGGDEDSDLGRATQLALRLEASYGLGDLGPVWIAPSAQRDFLLMPELRASVRLRIEHAQKAATDLLAGNRKALDALGASLFDRGYLDRTEMNDLLRPLSLRLANASTSTPGTQVGTIGPEQPESSTGDSGSVGDP